MISVKNVLICLLVACMNLAYAAEVTVQSNYYTGSLSSYISTWNSCGEDVKKFNRDEYESQTEFEQRKARASANCEGFKDVQVSAPWKLNYNADRQMFVINLSNVFNGLQIKGLVDARGGSGGPKGCVGGPVSCNNRWSSSPYYSCTIYKEADCLKPYFSTDSIVRRVDIDAVCKREYYRSLHSCWKSSKEYIINYKNIAIYIPLNEARKLKSHEDSLFIVMEGELEENNLLIVKSLKIIDRSNNRTIAFWKK